MTPSEAIARVSAAKLAEDAFPGIRDAAGLQAAFRDLAMLLHPDRAGAGADRAMASLNVLRDEAERKLAAGTWGKRLPAAGLQIMAKATYRDVRPLAGGDTCDVYEADFSDGSVERRAAIKLVREPRDADLSASEWTVLSDLWSKTDEGSLGFQRYLWTRGTWSGCGGACLGRVRPIVEPGPIDPAGLAAELGLRLAATSRGPAARDKTWYL